MARTTTPNELAARLGVTPKRLRDWLRATYPRSEGDRYARWEIEEAMERRAIAELGR